MIACVGDDTPGGSSGGSTSSGSSSSGGTSSSGSSGASSSSGGQMDAGLAAFSISPQTPLVKRGGSVQLTVNVDRKGVTGDIALAFVGLPSGVTASTAIVPAASASTNVTLSASATATVGSAMVTLKGTGVGDLAFRLLVADLPGKLDQSFDSDGFLIDTSPAAGVFYAVTTQADGSIVAVGATTTAATSAWIARRFSIDGAPDTTFDTNAAAVMPATGAARGVAIDPTTRRIVIVGSSSATPEKLTMVRLNETGTPDQGFGNAGTVLGSTVTYPQDTRANAVLVFADSSILFGGYSGPAGTSRFAIVEHYTSTGDRDTTTGYVQYKNTAASTVTSLVPLAGGSVLAGGSADSLSPPGALAVRLLSNGTPDGTFGGTGTRTYSTCKGAALALFSGGQAVIAGRDVTGPSFCIETFDAKMSGNVGTEKSFGGGNAAQLLAAASGADDTAYVAGFDHGSTMDKFAIARQYYSDGGLVPTFGTAGEVRFEDPGTPDTYAYAFYGAAAQQDGRLLLVGQRIINNTGALIMRVWP
jgi:uncharacterized delta-60 repeat protein